MNTQTRSGPNLRCLNFQSQSSSEKPVLFPFASGWSERKEEGEENLASCHFQRVRVFGRDVAA